MQNLAGEPGLRARRATIPAGCIASAGNFGERLEPSPPHTSLLEATVPRHDSTVNQGVLIQGARFLSQPSLPKEPSPRSGERCGEPGKERERCVWPDAYGQDWTDPVVLQRPTDSLLLRSVERHAIYLQRPVSLGHPPRGIASGACEIYVPAFPPSISVLAPSTVVRLPIQSRPFPGATGPAIVHANGSTSLHSRPPVPTHRSRASVSAAVVRQAKLSPLL